jgi:predicted Fe-Mo cluster-binding NifX family protein
MIVCLPVTADGQLGQSWGRADRVAIAEVGATEITSWQEFEVGWDKSHDVGEHSEHHDRIARFLIDHHVGCVVAGHMGPPMVEMLGEMGINVRLGAAGEARAAAVAATVAARN